jgi:putative MATE family efflux protein
VKDQEIDKKELFERVPAGKAVFTMAVPTIISQLINLLYNMVDTFFIGRTGNSYMMAAVTVSFPLYMLTIAFSNLFGIGGGSEMARLIGKNRDDRAKKVCAYAIAGTVVLAAAYAALVGIFETPLLYLLGASARTIGFARQYTNTVVICGSVPIILSLVLAHLLRNVGYSRQAGFGLSAGGVLNMILDPLFMFVLLPDGMEVFGAAFATLLSNLFSLVYFIVVLARLKNDAPIDFRLRAAKETTKEERRELYAVGIPSSILTGLFDLANVFLNSLMASHGDLEVAAIGIVMKIERLPNAINIGICQGMLPIVAYNFSSGNHDRMEHVIRITRKAGLIVSVVSMVLFQILAGPFVGLFLATGGSSAGEAARTLAYATMFLRIRCIASPFQFLNYSTSFSMQGIGDGRDTLIHASARELLFYIPFMYILNALFGVPGLASALIPGELCGAVLAQILLGRYLKKHRSAGRNEIPAE